jgi:hypothetical protein
MAHATIDFQRRDAWRVWHVPDFEPSELIERVEREGFPVLARFESVGNRNGYWKGAPLRTKTALRYRVKQVLLGQSLPRRSEFKNLIWLRERLFAAPRPLAIGEWHGRGGIRYQWLFTETLEERVTWSEAWGGLEAPQRSPLILHLADEVARMHALHFVHRDLFPRNLMVAPVSHPQPVAFLDAWAGGPGLGLRGPSYDIACLALDWPDTWERAEQALFLERYRLGRAAQGKPIRNVRGWLQSVERQRDAWVGKLEASPRRRGGRPVPKAEWRAPEPGGPTV